MKTYFIVAQADTDSEGYLKNSTILCDKDGNTELYVSAEEARESIDRTVAEFADVNYAPPKGGELVMLPMFPWQAYSTIGWLTDTLPSRFIGMPLNEKGCLITLQ